MNIQDSPLEKWLRKNHMTTKDFCNLVGCSRTVIWKVKCGKPVCPRIAEKINSLTDCIVSPLINPIGGTRRSSA